MFLFLLACSKAPSAPPPATTPSPAPDDSNGCAVSDFASMRAHVEERVLMSSTGRAWVFSYPPVKHDGVMRPPAPGETRYTAWVEGETVRVKWDGGEVTIHPDRTEGGELLPAVRCYMGDAS